MAEPSQDLPASAILALRQRRKIEAIKILRQESGCGLKEAMDAVEAYVGNHPELASHLREEGTGMQRWQRGLGWLFTLGFLYYAVVQLRRDGWRSLWWVIYVLLAISIGIPDPAPERRWRSALLWCRLVAILLAVTILGISFYLRPKP